MVTPPVPASSLPNTSNSPSPAAQGPVVSASNTALATPGAAAVALLAVREVLHRRWLKTGGNRRAFLLLCPNLTIVALAAKAMLDHGSDARLTAWLVLTGLFMTIPTILLLPAGSEVSAGIKDPQTPTATSAAEPVLTASGSESRT